MRRFRGIIAVEGMDGTGKTTITNKLQEIFGNSICVYHRTQKKRITAHILEGTLFQKFHALQIPVYLLLSIVNYFRCPFTKDAKVLIMDRCFLSNICYFYPKALTNKWIYRMAMLFEINLLPDSIFIIDDDEEVARIRDQNRKTVEWLAYARRNYLRAIQSTTLSKFRITIIPATVSLDQKALLIASKVESYMGE